MQHALNTQCLNPKRVMNPYTGQTLVVPCGHCKACALNKSQHLSLLCDLEAQSHKYCVFVTLTYANRFIPRAQLVDSVDGICEYDLVSHDSEILSHVFIRDEEKEKLLNKFYLFGSVPYLRKTDLQKFIKRFRFHAKKVSSERLRYFACGEYGPVHYRPHFHLLFYFSDSALLQVCEQIVLACWPFGRVDVQLSRGNCSSYVAGYVNSTCALPEIFKANAIRPFVVHSTRLGKKFLDSQCPQVYQTSVDEFIKRGVQFGKNYREFNLSRSYYSYYFPKCKGYSAKSARERAYAYRIYDTARKIFPQAKNSKELAVLIAESAYYFGNDEFLLRDDDPDKKLVQTMGLFDSEPSYKMSVSSQWNDLIGYFTDRNYIPTLTTDEFEKWVQRIYTELLLSKHFLYVVCDKHTVAEQYRKLKLIDSFYSRLDYLHLTSFFESQCKFYESDLFGDDEMCSDGENQFVPYFYQNVDYDLDVYKQSLTYGVFSYDVQRLFESRIKHKKLNDANKIFIDESI